MSSILKTFDQPLPQETLNIADKTRSNLFAWRGQFSPQLIEALLKAYCLSNSVILDPFVGSGTVLLEAARLGFESYGCEINPAAYLLSKTYELTNHFPRKEFINNLRKVIDQEFPFRIFEQDTPVANLAEKLQRISQRLDQIELIIFHTLVISLDINNHTITNELIQNKFANLVNIIEQLPTTKNLIKVSLSDARSLPLKNDSVDFIVTSPPYINVFNYHQNYRQSAEILGWDILKIAKSEIGSNRANRSNRFYTVIQYCLDIAEVLREISRISKSKARIIFVIGYQSQVLGVPFYNADILEKIAIRSHLFASIFRQKREFKNQFGKIIREDLIHLVNLKKTISQETIKEVAQKVALEALMNSFSHVSSQNHSFLKTAINDLDTISGTPILDLTSSQLLTLNP